MVALSSAQTRLSPQGSSGICLHILTEIWTVAVTLEPSRELKGQRGERRTSSSLRELTLKLLPLFDQCAFWLVVSIQSESCKQLKEEFELGGCKVLDFTVTGVGPQVPVTCGRRDSAHLHALHHR